MFNARALDREVVMVGTQERRTLNPTIRKNKHLDLNSLFMIKPPNPNVLSGGLIGLIMSLCPVSRAPSPSRTMTLSTHVHGTNLDMQLQEYLLSWGPGSWYMFNHAVPRTCTSRKILLVLHVLIQQYLWLRDMLPRVSPTWGTGTLGIMSLSHMSRARSTC